MPKHLSPLQLKYRQIAGQPNYETILELLEALRTQVSDARVNVSETDSLELRRAMDNFLQGAISDISRIRRNELTPSFDRDNNEDN